MITPAHYAKSNRISRGKFYLAMVRTENNKIRLTRRKLRKAAEAEASALRLCDRANRMEKFMERMVGA